MGERLIEDAVRQRMLADLETCPTCPCATSLWLTKGVGLDGCLHCHLRKKPPVGPNPSSVASWTAIGAASHGVRLPI